MQPYHAGFVHLRTRFNCCILDNYCNLLVSWGTSVDVQVTRPQKIFPVFVGYESWLQKQRSSVNVAVVSAVCVPFKFPVLIVKVLLKNKGTIYNCGTYATSADCNFVVPLLQIKNVKVVFEDEITRAYLAGWCVCAGRRCRTGSSTLRFGQVQGSQQ